MAEQKPQTDPWEQEAAAFKGAPAGTSSTAPADNENDYSVWNQTGGQPQEQQGFISSALDSSGLSSIGHAMMTPLESAKGMAQHVLNPNADLEKSVMAMKDGYKSGGLRGVGKAFVDSNPLVSPLGTAQKQYDAKNYSGMAGTVAGAVAPWLLPEAKELAVAKMPSRAKGAALLEGVMNEAGKQPVNLARTQPLLERAMQLSDSGHGTVSPLDKLFARINETTPIEFPEARDRVSALSSLTGEDKMRATPTLQRQTKQLTKAFHGDIGDAAESVRPGLGAQYNNGIKAYSRGARFEDVMQNAKKAAVPIAAGAAGMGVAEHFIRKAMQ